jgi:hypothetical protein
LQQTSDAKPVAVAAMMVEKKAAAVFPQGTPQGFLVRFGQVDDHQTVEDISGDVKGSLRRH